MNNRKLIQVTTIILIGFILVGCTGGGDTGGTDNGGGTSIDQTIRLQFWGVFLDKDIMEPLIADYQQLNPNVEITYENRWPGGNRSVAAGVYKTNLERVLNTNDPVQIPDIFMVENTWAGNYDERYAVSAPGAVMDKATLEAQFYPAVLTDFSSELGVNGLPLWMDTLAIVYNRDLLAEVAVTSPPTDWVGFRNLAEDLTFSAGVNGFAAGSSNNIDFAVQMLYALFFQNGVSMTNVLGTPVFANDTDSTSALEFYLDFGESGSIASWSSNYPNDSLSFLEGDTAMIAVPYWRYEDIKYFNTTYNLGLDIGVSPIPQINPENPRNIATYWGAMVARNRPNSEASWRFLQWLTQPEQLRKIRANQISAGEPGIIYPRLDMQSDLSFETGVNVFSNSLTNARSWYMVDGRRVESVFRTLILEGSKTGALSTAQSAVRDIIDSKGLLLLQQ